MPTPTKKTRRLDRTEPFHPVIGLEAEFSLFVRDEQHKPEHLFRDPQSLVQRPTLTEEDRSTSFWTSAGVGLVLTGGWFRKRCFT